MVGRTLLDRRVLLISAFLIPLIILSWTTIQAEATATEDEGGAGEEGRSDDHQPCPSPEKQSDLNSFLWTINRDPPSYFFGSIHVPFNQVWNHIPLNSKEAFQRADQVYFELDLTEPETISSLSDCQLLPGGEKLSNIIPAELFRRLRRHLQYVRNRMPRWMTADQRSRGLYADTLFDAITGNWEHKRPVWVMLMVNSLTEKSVKSKGIPVLDLYLAQEAEKLMKKTGAIERVEEHCVPLNELNFSQALFTLNQTLLQQEQTYRTGAMTAAAPPNYSTADLVHHYNCGDLDTIIYSADSAQVPNIVNAEVMQEGTARRINQYFHDELIYKRNQRMANRVARLIRENPQQSFFFTFGAGHFLGNNTVIDQLLHKGFNVTFTPAGEEVYLGENYARQELRGDLVAEVSSEPIQHSAILTPPYIDPFSANKNHRQRHRKHRGQRKNRRREQAIGSPSPTDSDRLHRPQFNDLWVRIEATSFGPNSLFHRLQSPIPATTPAPAPAEKYAMYNSSSASSSRQCCTTLYSSVLSVVLAATTAALFSL